jgi:drug/metabolite transporter (DMT)-like permease
MIAVAAGVLAAILWGTSGVAASRSSRLIGPQVALAWVFVTGLAVTLPVALLRGLPHPGASGIAWTAVAGGSAVGSLFLMYASLRSGPVSLVMPVMGAQGGLAALIAVALGEHLRAVAGAGLLVMTVGMVLVVRRPGRGAGRAAHPSVAVVLAAASAVLGAVALFGSARGAAALGAVWLVAAIRTAGVLGLAIPLACSGQLRSPGRALPLVVFSGLADTAAFASYVVGTEHGGIAVPAVLSSQYAAVSAVIAIGAMGERPTRLQLAGALAILAGVAIVTAVQS